MSDNSMRLDVFDKYSQLLDAVEPILCVGNVTRVTGQLIESDGPQAEIGEVCRIIINESKEIMAEVVGFREKRLQLMSYESIEGIEIGSEVVASGEPLSISVSNGLLGRVIDSKGFPIDGKGAILGLEKYSIFNSAPDVMKRTPINQRIFTGVRAIDFMTPTAKGQRLGIFSGSGVGKSTLLGMIARNTDAQVNIIALIGEHGREVLDTLERDLGEEGLKNSVVIVSTSDTPALSRVRGAYVAMAVAEYFRDQGLNVMMLFDSVTRLAMAQREIGLSIGEPAATKGYTPSVAVILQQILERCGTNEHGSITGFFTVLVEGDDMDDYVADTVRGIVDGHIILDRKLANQYHFPAIDVLGSLSRLATRVTQKLEQNAAGHFRRLLSIYQEKEDLINVGAYTQGANALLDEAIAKIESINELLRQDEFEKIDHNETLAKVEELVEFKIREIEE